MGTTEDPEFFLEVVLPKNLKFKTLSSGCSVFTRGLLSSLPAEPSGGSAGDFELDAFVDAVPEGAAVLCVDAVPEGAAVWEVCASSVLSLSSVLSGDALGSSAVEDEEVPSDLG